MNTYFCPTTYGLSFTFSYLRPKQTFNSTMAKPSWFRQTIRGISKFLGSNTGTDASAAKPDLQKMTHPYAEKNGQLLELDVYQLATEVERKDRLAVLYFHGGGFSEGSRSEIRYVQFAEKLARLGLVAIPCSYHLSMRGRSMSCDQQQSIKIAAFRSAAEDVWSATRFVLEHAEAWGIHPERIILAGSSAGAEAIVNAAYWKEGELGLEQRGLPAGFRYAGLLVMAGALLDINWITAENALPSLLFHGESDPLVPYGAASHHLCKPDQPGYLPLFGAGAIAQRLKALNKPYMLVSGTEGGHGWADKPMFEHLDAIADFMGSAEKLQTFRQIEERWKWSKKI
ncbi:alpha/beta hydrolase [Haliscomenobacter sp.]|uniref:alpha/beta hydrolase n=1 Tax=Haliscomenobacter sp. TaxID=2717303 RepID=UPI003593BA16